MTTKSSGQKVWVLKTNGADPEEVKEMLNQGRYHLDVGPSFGGADPTSFKDDREGFIAHCNQIAKGDRSKDSTKTIFGGQQWDLCWAMKPGDRVVLITKQGNKWKGSCIISKGRVIGNYRCEKSQRIPDDGFCHSVEVEWEGNFTEIAKDTDGYKLTMLMVIDVTDDVELLRKIGEESVSLESSPLPPEALKPRPEHKFPGPLNMILCGPPGTGKTYNTINKSVALCHAKDIPAWVMPSDENRAVLEREFQRLISVGRIEFVTFHQSYDYGDFIQGIRPSLDGGAMTFTHVKGPLKRIADRATESYDDPAGPQPFVLIIDEINRGNLSKVFGELITLVEEDKRGVKGCEGGLSVPLLNPRTPGERFQLPPNLYIIGTLNTADRSIQRLDSAMRRRFDFEEARPDPAKLNDNPRLATFLRTLNERLRKARPDSGCMIGHAWLMDKKGSALMDGEEICRALNNKVLPLLREWFWDQTDELKEDILKDADCFEDNDIRKISTDGLQGFLDSFRQP